MPIAYSYKRFSSDAQEGNDSIRRQTAAAKRFIDDHPEYGLELDTTLSLVDAGISAYKGRNIKSGALGIFMDAVRDSLIPAGSWLLLESFDRFTRQSVNIAANELLGLINRDIIVVTLQDQKIYRQDSFDTQDGFTNLLGAMIAMQGYHMEQVAKGKRVTEAWRANYSKIHSTCGRHVVTRIIPFWLKINSERSGFEVIEEKANVVREIFQRRANGEGKTKIAADLTARNVPTSKGRSEIWHPSAIHKLLSSDSVIGTLVNNKGERYENYYPCIVDQEVFQAVNALRKQAPAMGGTSKSHPLTGLIKHDCGTTMRRINKGANSGSQPKLQCPKCRIGLPFKTALQLVESALHMSQYVPTKTMHGDDIHGLENVIGNLADEAEDAHALWRKTKTLQARQKWERLLEELAALKEELRQLRGSNTEVLQAIEEQAMQRAIKAGSLVHSIRSVIRNAHFDISCHKLTVETISSKLIVVGTEESTLRAL